MKRRDFLKNAVVAPAAVTSFDAPASTKIDNHGLARFHDGDSTVIVNYIDKQIQVNGQPNFWTIFDQMCDFEEDRFDLPGKPFQYISGGRENLCQACLVDNSWHGKNLINVRGAIFTGFTAFDFIVTRIQPDPTARLYLCNIKIELDDQCLLVVPNDLLCMHKSRRLGENKYFFMFDKSTEFGHQHFEIEESSATWLNVVPL